MLNLAKLCHLMSTFVDLGRCVGCFCLTGRLVDGPPRRMTAGFMDRAEGGKHSARLAGRHECVPTPAAAIG